MNGPAYDSRLELKKAMWGFVSLLGSSVISALGFIVIAANRWISVDPASGVFIILFVQWQTLGLTIAKTGIEQVVFAMVSERENAYLDPAKYIYRKAAPLAGMFSLAVLFVFSPWAAFVAFATILLDTYSLIVMADLNAREMFRITALSNLFNYPLFFIVIFTINHYGRLTATTALAVFLFSSIVRWLWLKSNRFVRPGMREAVCTVNGQMGLQQALNYLLFRADQLVLALVGLNMQVHEHVGMYVFLAKFPELVSGVMVVAGAAFFPRVHLTYPFDHRDIVGLVRKHPAPAAAYVTGLAVSLSIYVRLWKGESVPFLMAVPFLIHSVCILLANNITYSSLRHGYLQGLLFNLAVSVSAGILMSGLLFVHFSAGTLAWLVPLQLLVFVAVSFLLKWGRTGELYG